MNKLIFAVIMMSTSLVLSGAQTQKNTGKNEKGASKVEKSSGVKNNPESRNKI